jgi:hypothetical protein
VMAVRSIRIRSPTWLRSGGSTISTKSGGTATSAVRLTGCRACAASFLTKRKTRSSNWPGSNARWSAHQQTRLEKMPPSLIAGVDVGGGEAETVVYLCASKQGQHKIINMGAWRGGDTRGEVVRFLAPYRDHLTSVRVDDIGIGHNFGLHLRDPERFPVELVNVSLPCQGRPEWHENDPSKRFANLKAQFYQTLADAFEHDQIDGLTDDETIGQLADIMYEHDSHGRMKIEPKEKARQRGVRSSDRAEALMLALGKPYSGGEIILVPVGRPYAPSRPIERTEAHPWGGFVGSSYKDPNDRAATVRRIRKGGRFHRSAW